MVPTLTCAFSESELSLILKNYTELLGFHDLHGYVENSAFLTVDLLQGSILSSRWSKKAGAVQGDGQSYQDFLQALKQQFQLKDNHPFLQALDLEHLLKSYHKGTCYQSLEFAVDQKSGRIWLRVSTNIHQEGEQLILDVSLLTSDKYCPSAASQTHKADLDSLTGLLNRAGLERRVDSYIGNHADSHSALLMVDIDNFKRFNDMFGHANGDKVLITLGEELRMVFGHSAYISRNGGDEFLLFVRGCKDRHLVALIQEFVGKEHAVEINGKTYPYTVSLGYSTYPDQAASFSRLYRYADTALYAVKLRGKGTFLRYKQEMETDERSQLGFSLEDLAKGLPGAILIYKADKTEQILFANDELIRIFGCDDLEDFLDLVKGSFRTLVHPDDVERVEASIQNQIEQEDLDRDFVEYRIITKQGEVKEIFDAGKLVHSAYFGDVFYVFLYDKEEQRRLLAHC